MFLFITIIIVLRRKRFRKVFGALGHLFFLWYRIQKLVLENLLLMDFSHMFEKTTNNVPLYERGCPKDWGFLSFYYKKSSAPQNCGTPPFKKEDKILHFVRNDKKIPPLPASTFSKEENIIDGFLAVFEMTKDCHSEELKATWESIV